MTAPVVFELRCTETRELCSFDGARSWFIEFRDEFGGRMAIDSIGSSPQAFATGARYRIEISPSDEAPR